MEIKNYIIGKLVPDMLRKKVINIEGCDETEFINIDSVDVNQLTEAFALTMPFAVDVTLSRYCERDVKHKFHLVVKVSAELFVLIGNIFISKDKIRRRRLSSCLHVSHRTNKCNQNKPFLNSEQP